MYSKNIWKDASQEKVNASFQIFFEYIISLLFTYYTTFLTFYK